jgi:superfamily II DNA or RNA helicase
MATRSETFNQETPQGSRLPEYQPLPVVVYQDTTGMNSIDKVKLLWQLFVGRDDVYALRFESQYTGMAGYVPDCINEWVRPICQKPAIKCSQCKNQDFMPVRASVLASHLQGRKTVGTYVLLKDSTCKFLAADFDKQTWRKDVSAFAKTCRKLNIPVSIEISRSGNGAHAWIFFETPVPAVTARKLGTALISKTCLEERQLSLDSYDRLFPSQDKMPKGGMGNLIVLPLQGQPRIHGFSVFVDEDLKPILDQWDYLTKIKTISMFDLESLLIGLVGPDDPLDVAFLNHETNQKLLKSPLPQKIDGPQPKKLNIVLESGIQFDTAELTEGLKHRLIRLACFQNKKYYVNQKMGYSVKMERRVLSEFKLLKRTLTIPRGCLEAVRSLLDLNGIEPIFEDRRSGGSPISVTFTGQLWVQQQAALDDLLKFDNGVLSAPPAFGKTVTAAALIATRSVSTLIIVDTTILLDQWKDRLSKFLGLNPDEIGTLVSGKDRLTGMIDIACAASLPGLKDLEGKLGKYGQILIDECHHCAANSYKGWMGLATPRFILGMSAEDKRSDGHQPYVFMRCGPIRHWGQKASNAPKDLQAIIRYRKNIIDLPAEATATDLHEWISRNTERTSDIVGDVLENYALGRKCLVLAERVEHVKAIALALKGKVKLFVLASKAKGAQSKRAVIQALSELEPGTPHVVVATSKLAGEGIDHPPLDTLFLSAPFSWEGRLRQYAGRLDRSDPFKTCTKVYDYVDEGHPTTLKMWARRRPRYKKLGYRFVGDNPIEDLFGFD